MTAQAFLDQAEERIRRTGGRATPGRIRVLAYLLTQQGAVTHHQIAAALNRHEKIDRVTLYRALEWLTEHGLVRKPASVGRGWRFCINDKDVGCHQHAHFKCNHCAKVICLDELRPSTETPALPAGYRGMEIELTVKGVCAECAG